MEELLNGSIITLLDKAGALTIVLLVAFAVITDRLIWHTRYKAAQARADRWEEIALTALMAGAEAGVQAAETAVDVVSALPDPLKGRKDAG